MNKEKEKYDWRSDFHITDTDQRTKQMHKAENYARQRGRKDFNETVNPQDYVAANLLEGEWVKKSTLLEGLGGRPRAAQKRLNTILGHIESDVSGSIIQEELDFEDEEGNVHSEIGIRLVFLEE